MYFVYRFLDKSKRVIYVGKSKQDLVQRFRGHLHLPEACYELTYKIEYIECNAESDMTIKEIYYINKFRNKDVYFNVLDMTDNPVSIEFNDKWKQYKGPLDEHFKNSINYKKGYTTLTKVRYNKDGSLDQRKSNRQKGNSSLVEALTRDDINKIILFYINKINVAKNQFQQIVWVRNLTMFILAVNLPIKAKDFVELKYKDLFSENNSPKSYILKLGRYGKDQDIEIPLRMIVKSILNVYSQICGLTYKENANDFLFQSRKGECISSHSWRHIVKEAAISVGIQKNIGTESFRKSYGLNIYNLSENKFSAILFLGELWGQSRESQIIRYLDLVDDEIDFSYYLGETFTLGNFDISQIKGLFSNNNPLFSKNTVDHPSTNSTNLKFQKKEPKKKNREWTPEQKLEIVLKHIDQQIPQKNLAQEYGVDKTYLSRWINDYKIYGTVAFTDRRKNTNHTTV